MSRQRWLAVGVLAAVILGSPGLATAAATLPAGALPAGASPSPSPNDDAPAKVTVTKLAPRAPLDAREFFQVSGTITNRGSAPLSDLRVRLRRGAVLQTRSQLADADTDPPSTGVRIGTPVPPADRLLAPGQTTTFDLRVRVGLLQLREFGVYPLEVEVRGVVDGETSVGKVGGVLTYVPWFPGGAPRGRVRLAWLWPLVDEPRRGPREVMVDDELSESLAPQGRLGRLLRAAADGQAGRCDDRALGPIGASPAPPAGPCRGEDVPMTYAVDPDLLFTADAMTTPYQVRVTEDRNRRVDDVEPARQWLATLRRAVGGSDAEPGADLLALPYADPDVVALTAPETGLADEVAQLRELGRREAARVTGRAPLTTVVVPPAGPLTRRALEALTSGGATAVVLDPAAFPSPDAPPARTPDAVVGQLAQQTGVPVNGLVIDTVLSALLDPDLADYPGARVVEQRWLAETAIIAAEAPSLSRTLVVAPPRRADLVASVASAAIRDSGRLPWLCAVSLASVAAGSDGCPNSVRTTPREIGPVELERPLTTAPALSSTHLAAVATARRASAQFTDEVLDPTSQEAVRTTARLLRARARTESSAWREDPVGGGRMLALLQDDLADLRGKVHLQVGRGTVTLTSSTGVISVNVVNELGQPVRVGVQLSSAGARLSTSQTPVERVPAAFAQQINLEVTSTTSGAFAVRAQLVDSSRRPFGDPVDLVVRSTQYGRVALAVTGLAAGVLLAAAGYRIARRALRRGPPAGAPG